MSYLYPFPYFGGKVMILPWILKHIPPGHTLIDLFGGSASVGLNSRDKFSKIIYNDLDSRLYNFFKVMRDQPEPLMYAILNTPVSREEYDACIHGSEDPVEDARCTYVRIAQSFGSLGLSGRSIGWSTGTDKSNNMAAQNEGRLIMLSDIRNTLRAQFTIENLPFEDVIEKYAKPYTVIFADPPYDLKARTGGKGYKHEFTEEDHIRLNKMLSETDCPSVVCGYHSALYDELYAGWKLVEYEVPSSVATNGAKGRKTECLWLKGCGEFQKTCDLFETEDVYFEFS